MRYLTLCLCKFQLNINIAASASADLPSTGTGTDKTQLHQTVPLHLLVMGIVLQHVMQHSNNVFFLGGGSD